MDGFRSAVAELVRHSGMEGVKLDPSANVELMARRRPRWLAILGGGLIFIIVEKAQPATPL